MAVVLPLAGALPVAARAQAAGTASRPLGLTLSVSLGGGGVVGLGSAFTPSTVFETELTAGFPVGAGFAPEASLLVNMAPDPYLGLRAGLHYSVRGTPFYLRGALDLAAPRGSLRARWVLLGAGGELRLTSRVGGFAEVDGGIPLGKEGVPVLVRAGVFFSF